LFILLLALILLGPKRLPDAARAVGKGMREFRRATDDLKGTLEQELGDLQDPLRPEPPQPPRPVVEGTAVQRSLPAVAPASPEEPGQPSPPIPTSEPASKV